MIITAVFLPSNECEVKMLSVLGKSESNTWQQIRAKTELRNISGGPRGGIAARETRQHRKGGNTVYHKKTDSTL